MEQATGHALHHAQAIAYAQKLPLQAAQLHQKKSDGLTTREVAVLITHGKSNAELADDLVVSKRTVESHIATILTKLGFTNRAQIVR